MIDFESEATHVLLNPRMPKEDRVSLEQLAAKFPLRGHVWMATSGTTGALKLTALSKQAILASAAAVNAHLGSDARDVWCNVLPPFHVGGLGIHARAHLSGARVVVRQWSAHVFEEGMTLSALVPAEVRDLVDAGVRPPSTLRAIVIGGGALPDDLYRAGRARGWPLLPSYGMTECCSQVATATLASPDMLLLPHFEGRVEPDGRLAFRGPSTLTGYAFLDGTFVDPKSGGWFVSEDLGTIEGGVVRVEGRRGEFVKIGGESVDLARLDAIADAVARESGIDAAIIAVPDARLGHVIHCAATSDARAFADAFNARVLPFERIRGVHRVDAIPRSPLGKLQRAKLLDAISLR